MVSAKRNQRAQQLGVLAKKILPRGAPDASRQGLQRMPTCEGNNEDSRRGARMKSSIASIFAALVCLTIRCLTPGNELLDFLKL